MASKLDLHRRVVAEILSIIVEGGLAGSNLDPALINKRLAPDGNIRIEEFIALMGWLQDEGVVRATRPPNLHGQYFRVQPTSLALSILELDSPLGESSSIEADLASATSPESRTKIGEFIGSVLGASFGSLLNTQR